MLKKIATITTLAGALALGACGTTGGLPASTTTTDPTVSSVIQAVRTGCAYVAPASQVASIITTFTGGSSIVDLVGTVANSICSAVTAKGASRGVSPSVNGVPLTGHFLAGAHRRR